MNYFVSSFVESEAEAQGFASFSKLRSFEGGGGGNKVLSFEISLARSVKTEEGGKNIRSKPGSSFIR